MTCQKWWLIKFIIILCNSLIMQLHIFDTASGGLHLKLLPWCVAYVRAYSAVWLESNGSAWRTCATQMVLPCNPNASCCYPGYQGHIGLRSCIGRCQKFPCKNRELLHRTPEAATVVTLLLPVNLAVPQYSCRLIVPFHNDFLLAVNSLNNVN